MSFRSPVTIDQAGYMLARNTTDATKNDNNVKNDRLTTMIKGLTSEITFVISIITLVMTLGVEAGAAQEQDEAYAQGAAKYDEIDEDHQPLIAEILNALLNQTVDEITINENSQMVLTFRDAVTPRPPIPSSPVAPPTRPSILNNANSLPDVTVGDIAIVMPHNFTTQNGYEFRDGKIYKPDGTEIFS